MNELNFDTLAIHGDRTKNPLNAVQPPIFQSASYEFDSVADVDAAMGSSEGGFVYTRGDNPTLALLEKRIALLEGGAGAVSFGSGMGAISSVLMSLLRSGDTIIAHKTLYGSSANLIEKVLPDYGIQYKMIDLTDLAQLASSFDDSVKVVYFETPVNPNLKLIDIAEVARIAHHHGVKVVTDNTFASPHLQQPLTLGADVVVHSSTKFINGHGDAVGGLAIAQDLNYLNELRFNYMCTFGSVMSPFNAWLTLRGLKTLGVRIRQMQASALKIAALLENSEQVATVYYPGLASFAGHDIVQAQMAGPGAILSFVLTDPKLETAQKFIDHTKLFKIAVSLGDCDSHIELPATMTHKGHSADDLEKLDIHPSLIRISVGLEDEQDLIKDIEGALAALKRE